MFKYTINPQITNARNLYYIFISYNIYYIFILACLGKLSMLVGISEAICVLFNNDTLSLLILPLLKKENPYKFIQWLAGLIDGDGCFQLSKKGYASFEITKDLRDKKALYLIKQKYGGSVKLRSGAKAKRYRLHHKEGLQKLINDLNGHIRNPIRLLQLNKIGEKYNIIIHFSNSSLFFFNAWFSGFFDVHGNITLSPNGINLSINNNEKYLLDNIMNIYGGNISFTNLTGRSFIWQINKKTDILTKVSYFQICPSFSAKMNRIRLIPLYFELKEKKAHLANINSINGKLWLNFKNKWDKWE